MRLIILSLFVMASTILSAQEVYLFAGTYTKGKSEGIYVYKFDTTSGEVKPVSTTFTENPSYLAVSPDKKYVYAVTENGNNKGAVSSFSFDQATGKLKLINTKLSNGDHPCYVSVDKTGKWVVAGNYTGGNFAVLRVKEDGTLNDAVQTIQHKGGSVNKQRQEKPHVHSVVFTPDGKYLAVTDLGTDKIVVYPFDPEKEKPVNEKPIEVAATPGSGPRHIVFHPNSNFAYVIEELSGKVSAYKVNGGKLEPLQTISSHPANYKGDIGSAAIKISNDGKYVYASNRGESNTIAVYEIESSGKLKLKGIEDSGGKAPRDFTIDPSDNFILSANANSDNITIYKRNKNTGLPEVAGKQVSIPQPVCLVFF